MITVRRLKVKKIENFDLKGNINLIFLQILLGVGPATAYKLIKDHKTIEAVTKHLLADNETSNRKKKYVVPKDFFYEDARELFLNPTVDEPSKFDVNKN